MVSLFNNVISQNWKYFFFYSTHNHGLSLQYINDLFIFNAIELYFKNACIKRWPKCWQYVYFYYSFASCFFINYWQYILLHIYFFSPPVRVMYEPKPNDHTRLVQGTIEEVLEGKEKFIIFSHDHPQGAGEFTMFIFFILIPPGITGLYLFFVSKVIPFNRIKRVLPS